MELIRRLGKIISFLQREVFNMSECRGAKYLLIDQSKVPWGSCINDLHYITYNNIYYIYYIT